MKLKDYIIDGNLFILKSSISTALRGVILIRNNTTQQLEDRQIVSVKLNNGAEHTINMSWESFIAELLDEPVVKNLPSISIKKISTRRKK